MGIVECKDICALCGQKVVINGFSLSGKEGVKKFCCQGCLSIYELLNDCTGLTNPNQTLNNNNEDTKK